MPPAGFQPVISARERLQTDALNPEATGMGYESLQSDRDLGIVNETLAIFIPDTPLLVLCQG